VLHELKAVPNIHRHSKHTTIRPTTSVRFSSTNIHHLPFAMALSPHHIEQHDARGLLIPDDVVKYSGNLRADPEAFWSSYQFYVEGLPENMLPTLSAIPDSHFHLIQSLCFDFD
jgi:hypothetical protein